MVDYEDGIPHDRCRDMHASGMVEYLLFVLHAQFFMFKFRSLCRRAALKPVADHAIDRAGKEAETRIRCSGNSDSSTLLS